MKVNGGILKYAVGLLDMIPSRGGIMSSQNFNLKAVGDRLRLRLCSEVFGESTIPISKDVYSIDATVDRVSLVGFCGVIDQAKDVSISYKEGVVVVSQGRRRARLYDITTGITSWGSVKRSKSEKELTFDEEGQKALRLCANYASADPVYPEYSCLYILKNIGVFASDGGWRFMYCPFKPSVSLPFPVILPNIIGKIEEARIYSMRSGVRVEGKVSKFYQPLHSAALKFPVSKCRSYLKEKTDLGFEVSSVRLQKRLNLFKGMAGTEGELTMTCVKGSNKVNLLMKNTCATFEDTITVRSRSRNDEVIIVQLPFIHPILDFAEKGTLVKVSFNDRFTRLDLSTGQVYIQARMAQSVEKPIQSDHKSRSKEEPEEDDFPF